MTPASNIHVFSLNMQKTAQAAKKAAAVLEETVFKFKIIQEKSALSHLIENHLTSHSSINTAINTTKSNKKTKIL